MLTTILDLGGITVDVHRKAIRNVHLRVYPPAGNVRISAPLRMSEESIRLFAISKLAWINRQRARVQDQARSSPRAYVDGESHAVWGQRVLLTVAEVDSAPSVELQHATLVLHVRPGSDTATRAAVVSAWSRQLVRAAAPALIAQWESQLNVTARGFFVQQMKTRWGTCNPRARTIRLNTELATKPRECLDYVVLHELVHLLEPNHGPGFVALMDRFAPTWRQTRALLNRRPETDDRWEC